MDFATASRISGQFVPAAFAALDATLGTKHRVDPLAPRAGDSTALERWCAAYPVWMQARVNGGGALAVLWSMADASRIVAAVGGEDPGAKTVLGPGDLGMLKELADAVLGAGGAALKDLLGGTVQIEAGGSIGKGPAELRTIVGEEPAAIEVNFSTGTAAGRTVLLVSAELEARVARQLDSSAMGGGIVSDAEVKDILSGFKPEDEPDRASPGAEGGNGSVPDNLDVVMDLELTATARLGKVEVPLAEVLEYGPGSIIELGHMVDEPVELLVNGKLVARGDVVVADERFGIRITEIVSPQERIESLR